MYQVNSFIAEKLPATNAGENIYELIFANSVIILEYSPPIINQITSTLNFGNHYAFVNQVKTCKCSAYFQNAFKNQFIWYQKRSAISVLQQGTKRLIKIVCDEVLQDLQMKESGLEEKVV